MNEIEQMDLFRPQRAARRSDPGTSHAAAERAAGMAQAHQERLLRALADHGPAGKSRLAQLTGLTDVAVARRLPELQRQGKARPTGRTVPSRAGRDEREWATA